MALMMASRVERVLIGGYAMLREQRFIRYDIKGHDVAFKGVESLVLEILQEVLKR